MYASVFFPSLAQPKYLKYKFMSERAVLYLTVSQTHMVMNKEYSGNDKDK